MVVKGIIRPPPEIRAVADKTASFVAKNGRGFETRIMNSAKGKTPKFAFLHESSPFHAYYEDRIVFYTNGGVDEEKKEEVATKEKQTTEGGGGGEEEEEKGTKTQEEKHEEKVVDHGKDKLMARKAKSIVDPVARALLDQRSRIQKALDSGSNDEEDAPSEQQRNEVIPTKETLIAPQKKYTVLVPPSNVSLSQLDVIKLTAQFVALNGRGGPFLRELTVREWNNPFWEFLQPRHSHYAYFTQLIEIYRRLLQEAVLIHEMETKQKTAETPANTSSLLELSKLKDMVSIDRELEETGDIQSQIELIQNTAGNVAKCLEHAAYHAEYERYYEEKRRKDMESMEGNGGIGGSAKVDWHDFVVVETIDFPIDEIVESLPPPPPPAPPVSLKSEAAQTQQVVDEMDESSEEDEEEEIKVVDEYAPKVVSSQAKFASESMTHVIDPITKKSIPIADMTEHMRIQLLDPKWAAEKAKFMEKQKESNLVSGDAIARNMMTFAKARTDLFGPSAPVESESNKQLDASLTASVHDQLQMPEPRPTVATAVPRTDTVFPGHAKPDIVAPEAKKPRLEILPPYGQAQVPPIQPAAMIPPPPPPPPPAVSVATLPSTSYPEPEQDSTPMETTLSEEEFVKSLPNREVPLLIKVPNDSNYAEYSFNGQTISFAVDVMTTIKAIKQQIQPQLGGMPVNKMQLRHSSTGFLKDSLSLAYFNIGPNNNSLELLPKVRGGRR